MTASIAGDCASFRFMPFLSLCHVFEYLHIQYIDFFPLWHTYTQTIKNELSCHCRMLCRNGLHIICIQNGTHITRHMRYDVFVYVHPTTFDFLYPVLLIPRWYIRIMWHYINAFHTRMHSQQMLGIHEWRAPRKCNRGCWASSDTHGHRHIQTWCIWELRAVVFIWSSSMHDITNVSSLGKCNSK